MEISSWLAVSGLSILVIIVLRLSFRWIAAEAKCSPGFCRKIDNLKGVNYDWFSKKPSGWTICDGIIAVRLRKGNYPDRKSIYAAACVYPSSSNPTTLTEPSQTSQPASATLPGALVSQGCKKIAFVLSSGSDLNIYTVCPDGSSLKQLKTGPLSSPGTDSSPAWSPDGSKIAFASSRSGSSQIYIMGADGGDPKKITSDYSNDFPIWLPNGQQIAFRTTDSKGLWWWRIVNIESDEMKQLTKPSYDFFFQTPAWSPDGKSVAFMSLVEQKLRNDGSSQIHVKNVDGSNDHALTSDIWANMSPVWSHDGTKIAFISERDGAYNQFALYVMAKDGTDLQKLTEPIFSENAKLSWSPDGRQIAIADEGTNRNIEIIDTTTEGFARTLAFDRHGKRLRTLLAAVMANQS